MQDKKFLATGATGRQTAHFSNVEAFFFSSTCSVYAPYGHTPLKETHPLGDAMRGHCQTYSMSKVAAEAVVKFAAEHFNIPTVIARMNVASTPALVMNWCGSQRVSAEEWCEYMAELLGVEANIVYAEQVFPCTP